MKEQKEVSGLNSNSSEKSEQGKQTSEVDFVKWFSELNKDSGTVAGGKGANLAEIYNLKISVPAGFVVTAQAYDYFIKNTSGMKEKIKKLLGGIDYEDTKKLDETTKQIRHLISNSEFPKEMEEELLEAYESLGIDKSLRHGTAHDILKSSPEPVFVAVRSSATTEDLAEASFAGQQDSYVNIKGNSELLNHIKKCFASLFTSRATYYRNKKGFKHEAASLAVVVQKMVDSDKSGVIFSKDPAYKNNNIVMEAVFGLGEGIVSGKITPDTYIISEELKILDKKIPPKKIAITRDSSGDREIVKLREEKSKSQVLNEHEIKTLSEVALRLEEHYKKPQDIEFAIEGEEIYIVQTRPITTIEKRIGDSKKKEGSEAIDSDSTGDDSKKELNGEVILEGLAASPGIASGKIKIVDKMEDLQKIKQGDILVTEMTNPDMVVSMQKSSAIVTDEGGLTSHASIVSREMGIPAVVGTQEATFKLREGEIITVNGFTGKIYKGKVSETIQKEIKPLKTKTKTKIKLIVDLPSFAERAAKTGIRKVGLTRIEGIIAESGKHPNYFLEKEEINEYEKVIFNGIKKISEYFDELWIRTSDIRSDEYQHLEGAPQEKEANPMLGMHGIRFSLRRPEILKAELNALKRISEEGKKIGLLLPQVILVEEVKKVKELLQEINFLNAKVGVMIETPAAVQIIKELCEEGIDFISFGTNDLTQYMLAIDRGNEEVQELYDEMHPAILHQLGYVIRVCKRYGVESSICGQAGSKKPMAKFLVEKGIDSISVNADVASDIAEHVAEIEKSLEKKAGTDEEEKPEEQRQYRPKKEKGNEDAEAEENSSDKEKEKIIEDPEIAIQEIEKEKQEYLNGNLSDDPVKSEKDLTENKKESTEKIDRETLDIF